MSNLSANILIVDDQLDNLRTLSVLLSGQGYHVRKATSGRMALATVKIEMPDLILLDIMMPEVDGYEVCRRFKADPDTTNIPIIFLSALDDFSDKVKAFDVGGVDYITKPFHSKEVLARIRYQLIIQSQRKQLKQEIINHQSAEDALRKKNEELRAVFEAFPDGFLRVSSAGNVLDYFSKAGSQSSQIGLLNHTSQEFIGKSLRDIFVPDVVLHIQRAVQQTLRTRIVTITEYSVTLGHETQHIELRMVPLPDHQVIIVIRDITAQKQASENAQQQAQRERMLGTLTQRIRQSLKLEDILKTAVDEVRQFLKVDRVVIYQFFADLSGSVVIEAVNSPDLSILGHVIYDPCFENKWHIPYLAGRVRAIRDIRAEPDLTPCHVAMLDSLQVRANLVMPLIRKRPLTDETLWGLLIAHHCTEVRDWQEWEIDLLKQLSEQLSIAIQQSLLYEQTLRQARREALLNDIIDSIRQSLDLDDILLRSANQLLKAFNVNCGIVGLLNQDNSMLCYSAAEPQVGMTKTYTAQINPQDYAFMNSVLTGIDPVLIDNLSIQQLNGFCPFFQTSTPHTSLWVPIRLENIARGFLSVHQLNRPCNWTGDEEILLKEVADQLAIALQQAELYQQLQRANQELERLANLDGLTQLANRRRFEEFLQQEWRRMQREQGYLSLIMCDVDFFKLYNDHYGHLAGDDCLRQVADVLSQTVKRPADLVARYGGEEFAVALPHTDVEGATCIAQQIQTAIAELNVPHSQSPKQQKITLSLGIASLIPHREITPSQLVAMADRALYQAKHEGRDTCCVITDIALAVFNSPQPNITQPNTTQPSSALSLEIYPTQQPGMAN